MRGKILDVEILYFYYRIFVVMVIYHKAKGSAWLYWEFYEFRATGGFPNDFTAGKKSELLRLTYRTETVKNSELIQRGEILWVLPEKNSDLSRQDWNILSAIK